jgi:hypothetical protein
MKLRELKRLVDLAVETSRDYEDHEVVIAVKLPYTTVGAIPMVAVKSVNKGFDWENGRYIIRAEEELTPADRDFATQMKKMQEDLGWSKYENRNLKAEIKKLKQQIGVA